MTLDTLTATVASLSKEVNPAGLVVALDKWHLPADVTASAAEAMTSAASQRRDDRSAEEAVAAAAIAVVAAAMAGSYRGKVNAAWAVAHAADAVAQAAWATAHAAARQAAPDLYEEATRPDLYEDESERRWCQVWQTVPTEIGAARRATAAANAAYHAAQSLGW